MLKFPRLVQLVLLVLAVDKIRGDCVWYGECGPSMNDGVYYCKYDGKPKLFNEDIETQNQLKSLCPHLFNGINQTYTCCAKDQLETLATSMSVPQQLMSRCPACYTNFRAFLCDLTCNPNMHEFLLVTDDEVTRLWNCSMTPAKVSNILRPAKQSWIYCVAHKRMAVHPNGSLSILATMHSPLSYLQ